MICLRLPNRPLTYIMIKCFYQISLEIIITTRRVFFVFSPFRNIGIRHARRTDHGRVQRLFDQVQSEGRHEPHVYVDVRHSDVQRKIIELVFTTTVCYYFITHRVSRISHPTSLLWETFWKNPHVMIAGAKYSVQEGGLLVRNVTHLDAGKYICRAFETTSKSSVSGQTEIDLKVRRKFYSYFYLYTWILSLLTGFIYNLYIQKGNKLPQQNK